ncbi:MAG: (2Fe-2S)-binding protein [Candidatus Riflebacteria bacterium]|nr:(2Fe-2S)-binding protein [Candidatus Riflebacteria bacterium]
MIDLVVNGKKYSLDVSPDTPLLWVIRDKLHLSGTKYGCGLGICGACTVHIDGIAQHSCQMQVKDAAGKEITTIEGIPEDHSVKVAWQEEDVSQCGWCQPGQIMAAVSLLKTKPQPGDSDIDSKMTGNICRCGTYQRIRRAIHKASKMTGEGVKK